MKIDDLKKMANENVNANISILFEVLNLLKHESKDEIRSIYNKHPQMIEEAMFNIIILYSLHAFVENKNEIEISVKTLKKIIEIHPIIKDVLSVYISVIHIKDINPSLSPKEAEEKNEKLIKVLSL